MTENEKLRALLAEARESVEADASFCVALMPNGTSRNLAGLLARIDAALAEPVEGPLNAISRLQRQLHEAESNADWLVQQAERKRDEARAEVERLKVQAETHEIRHRLAASEIRGLLASLSDALHESNKARAEVVSAYQRGAEAMREAALGAAWHHSAMYLHKQIRALPIPEDKP